MKFFGLAIAMLWFTAASASLVAVIDSGVDVDHPELAQHVWTNPVDGLNNNVDEDRNGYVDDFYGWNFVSDNNKVIDIEYASKFNSDVEKFFELQYLMYLYNKGINKLDKEFIDWYYNVLFPGGQINEEIAKDGEFFGGYAHGTHVAGIVAKQNPEVELLAVKLMGTKAKLKVRSEDAVASEDKAEENKGQLISAEQMNAYKDQLGQMARDNSKRFERIALYLKGHNARVANASFGTGFLMTFQWLNSALAGVDQNQIIELTLHFQTELVAANKIALGKANNTLFVAAAGNDEQNIDQLPDSPASIVSDNVISVAATWERNELADFSCFGTKTVHVAAPGVGIKSTAPGGNYVYMNGTSQAAPYVTKVASEVVDQNPGLTPKQVKEILMGTVDVKPWLADKVASSGIVNEKRAVAAAYYSTEYSIEEAIELANEEIADVPEPVLAKSNVEGPVVNFNIKSLVTKRPSSIIFK